jgi:hypothetical protein
VYPDRCRYATLVKSIEWFVVRVRKETASMCETIDYHDGFVMWMVDTCSFDDEMRSGWEADMMCSASQTIIPAVWPVGTELWLLFDDATFSLVLRGLACATGCDLACLHKLANVSTNVNNVNVGAMAQQHTIAGSDCRLRASRARSLRLRRDRQSP